MVDWKQLASDGEIARAKVLIKYPEAEVRPNPDTMYRGYKQGRYDWYVDSMTNTDNLIGFGDTVASAWLDAASRLEREVINE